MLSRLLVAAALVASASSTLANETIRVGGSGSTLGTIALLGEAFTRQNPAVGLRIVPNLGSAGGIKALLADNLEIVLITRPLKREDAALGLSAVEYGRSPFVLVTSRMDQNAITLADAVEMVAGRKSRWADGARVRVVLRPTSDIDSELLAGFSPEMHAALAEARKRDGMIVALNDQDAASEVERLPGALGTSTLALVRSEGRKLSVLSLDGVAPSPSTIADGSYRHMKSMQAVVKSGHSATVGRFVEFLRSSAARKILAQNGHWIDEPRAAATR